MRKEWFKGSKEDIYLNFRFCGNNGGEREKLFVFFEWVLGI